MHDIRAYSTPRISALSEMKKKKKTIRVVVMESFDYLLS